MEVLDIACRNGEILVLARARIGAASHRYFFVHYNALGERQAIYSPVFDAVPRAALRENVRAQGMVWREDIVEFDLLLPNEAHIRPYLVDIAAVAQVSAGK
jgi:hypothetical protein